MWTYFSFEGGSICHIGWLKKIFVLEIIYAKVEHCQVTETCGINWETLLRLSLFRLQSREICLLWLPSDMMEYLL